MILVDKYKIYRLYISDEGGWWICGYDDVRQLWSEGFSSLYPSGVDLSSPVLPDYFLLGRLTE